MTLPPLQFAYSLLTRSQRISHENLRQRDPRWLRAAEDWFQLEAGGTAGRAPMFAPFRLRDMALTNRVVVSPMAQYRAVDGCPTDWHFVHLGRARQRRRRPRLHRDDVRQPRRPHHARLRRPLRAGS